MRRAFCRDPYVGGASVECEEESLGWCTDACVAVILGIDTSKHCKQRTRRDSSVLHTFSLSPTARIRLHSLSVNPTEPLPDDDDDDDDDDDCRRVSATSNGSTVVLVLLLRVDRSFP